MATVLTDDANYTAIANAIRAKGGEGTFTPAQMATAIANLPSGGAGNKVLTSAIITGTASKIDISNYVNDDNFILFFGIDWSSTSSVYISAMYTPTIPFKINASTTEYGGFLIYKTNNANFMVLPSSGFTKLYAKSASENNALAAAQFMSRDYITYSNGIFTAKDSRYPFATSSILLYLAEATT